MKKYLGYFVEIMLAVIILSACGHDLSTPSSRLVGHWRNDTLNETGVDYYFSEIDENTKEGIFTRHWPESIKNSLPEQIQRAKYRVIRVIPEDTGDTVYLEVDWFEVEVLSDWSDEGILPRY